MKQQIFNVDEAAPFIASIDVDGLEKDMLVKLLNEYQVIKQGHFELLSSLHSKNFIQFNLFGKTILFSQLLGNYFLKDNIDVIFTRDTSSIRLATGIAELLEKDIVIAPVDERSYPQEESREDYEDLTNKKVLIVDDIITTGGGIKRLEKICQNYKAEIGGVAAFINRGYKSLKELQEETMIDKFVAICTGKFEHYKNTDCPICRAEGKTNLVKAKYLNKAITLTDIRKRINEKKQQAA